MNQTLYLDYAATTPMDPRVVQVMQRHLTQTGVFGNPASLNHPYGWKAQQAVDTAREQVAQAIHAAAREIVWVSGATEANNLAIKGVAWQYQARGKHLITMKTEHKAVLDTCAFLETQGFEITYLSPKTNGLLDIDQLKAALRPDTLLVSIMMVNNETGVMQDIATIAEVVKANGSFFHVDAVQAFGRCDIDLSRLPVDLMSFSAHKIYGPKGIGVLYVRVHPKVKLQPLLHGGGHEYGMRSGTLPTHQIAAMGEAFALSMQNQAEEVSRIAALRDQLWQGLQALDGVVLNGCVDHRACHILNVQFAGIDSEVLIKATPQLAYAAGAACNSAVIEPSHVLRAMGLSQQQAQSSVRFSLGRFTTEQDIQAAVTYLQDKVARLR